MSKELELELENYLSISPNKFAIYSFETNSLKNLYKEEIIINQKNFIDFDLLKNFLDKNIFKIEKLSGKFIKNIFLVCDDKNILNLKVGIKKKNYNTSINRDYIENLLTEAKDLFLENYQNEKIIHMIIHKYLINGKSYSLLEDDLKSDNIALELQFKSISKNFINEIDNILQKYQIKIVKSLDESYVKNLFNNDEELSEMCHKIMSGYNENEVRFIPKTSKKLAFFEKFFQLFS
tara:strand:- start:2747 stop:3451 length:705 start_codon:yes stop_codon:yes gene_type:complete